MPATPLHRTFLLPLCALAALILLQSSRADPQPPAQPPPRPHPILHITLSGDLDCARLATDFAQLLSESRDAAASATTPTSPTPVLVLELSGRRWRPDVVLAIARSIRNPQPPIKSIVYLNSPAAPIGTGHAALGLVADACFIAPRTHIAFEPGDDLSATLPDALDAELVTRELRALAWSSLQDRRADPLLTTLIPRPTARLFAVKTPAEPGTVPAAPVLRLTTTPPTSGDYITLFQPPADDATQPHLDINTDTLTRTHFAGGIARSLAEILSKQTIRSSRTTYKSLSSGLADARASLARTIREIDDARRQSAAAIDEVYRLRSAGAPGRQRRVADDQSPIIAEARKRLQAAEQLTTDYPELLHEPAPGATTIVQTRQTRQKSWRDLFQSRRADLEKLTARAQTLSEK